MSPLLEITPNGSARPAAPAVSPPIRSRADWTAVTWAIVRYVWREWWRRLRRFF